MLDTLTFNPTVHRVIDVSDEKKIQSNTSVLIHTQVFDYIFFVINNQNDPQSKFQSCSLSDFFDIKVETSNIDWYISTLTTF